MTSSSTTAAQQAIDLLRDRWGDVLTVAQELLADGIALEPIAA